MAEFSDFLENEVLDDLFGGAAFTPAGTLYLALTTTTPSDTLTGATISEPAGGGYARAALSFTGTASGGSIAGPDTTAITFTNTGASWTIKGVAIVDSATATGSNVYCFDAGFTSVTIGTGEKLQFAADSITVSLT